MSAFPVEKIERLIAISKANPLLPEDFIPWDLNIQEEDIFIPDFLISLQGHPLYDTLTSKQKKALGKHEVVQVMHSYAWSETLACLFFTRHLLTLDATSAEYRFLLREVIEEFQHQEMFSSAIIKLEGKPIPASWLHRVVGKISTKFGPADIIFMSVLAVEMVADSYGKIMRQDKSVFKVLRKVSELHNIEEGRHMHYTKMWLKRFTEKAGILRRTIYSLVIMGNIYFMRTLYVKKQIFQRIGVTDAKRYQKEAYRNYKQKFADHCLGEAISFTKEIGGFNWLTRGLWRRILKANV